jgi:hypothetical protein
MSVEYVTRLLLARRQCPGMTVIGSAAADDQLGLSVSGGGHRQPRAFGGDRNSFGLLLVGHGPTPIL